MRHLLLLVPILIAGCSHSQSTSPQNPPEPNSPGPIIETAAQLNAEINRRLPTSRSSVEIAQVVFDILDNAQNEKTIWAIKDNADTSLKIEESSAKTFSTAPSARDIAFQNIEKWTIAACDAKKATLLAASNSNAYQTAKKNALSEAARADSLPIN